MQRPQPLSSWVAGSCSTACWRHTRRLSAPSLLSTYSVLLSDSVILEWVERVRNAEDKTTITAKEAEKIIIQLAIYIHRLCHSGRVARVRDLENLTTTEIIKVTAIKTKKTTSPACCSCISNCSSTLPSWDVQETNRQQEATKIISPVVVHIQWIINVILEG